MSFFDGFELVLSYLDIYRNNVIFILVAERCVEVLVCMCFNRIRQKSPILYRWVMNAVRYEGYRW
ncbi:hypothetical protein EG869_07365 [Enterococcus faecium]|nr:hypothetical protein EG869_07365 [Enterococcus faecium]